MICATKLFEFLSSDCDAHFPCFDVKVEAAAEPARRVREDIVASPQTINSPPVMSRAAPVM